MARPPEREHRSRAGAVLLAGLVGALLLTGPAVRGAVAAEAAAAGSGDVEVDVSVAARTRGGYSHGELRQTLLVDAGALPVTSTADFLAHLLFDEILTPIDDTWFWLSFVLLEAELSVGDWMWVHARFDSGVVTYERTVEPAAVAETVAPGLQWPTNTRPYAFQIHGREPREEAEASGFLREIYARFLPCDGLSVAVGKQAWRVAAGYVYDDVAVGAQVGVEAFDIAGFPVTFEAGVGLPARDWVADAWTSPLAYLEVSLDLSPIEAVRVGGAYFRDAMDAMGATVRGALLAWTAERLAVRAATGAADPHLLPFVLATTDVGGRSHLGWAWLTVDWLWGDVLLHAHVVGVFGRARLTPDTTLAAGDPATTVLAVAAVAADVRATWPVARAVALEPFAVLMTGADGAPLARKGGARDYHGFIGVVPFWTFTNVFFSGGLNQTLSERGAAAAGVAGRGVAAVGLNAHFFPSRDWRFLARSAYLWAMADLPRAEGRGYGLELNAEAHWRALPFLALAAEADVLVTLGGAFPGTAAIWKVQVGADVVF